MCVSIILLLPYKNNKTLDEQKSQMTLNYFIKAACKNNKYKQMHFVVVAAAVKRILLSLLLVLEVNVKGEKW